MKLNKNIKLLIAADGLSASGKSTASKLISKKYNLELLNSGKLYRYIAYKLMKEKKIKNKNKFLKSITKNITPKKLKNKNLFNPQVTEYSAVIAKSKKIRMLLRNYQKKFSKRRLVCIEGRDIATVICPKADIKFFFQCNLNIRAKRRYLEYAHNKKNDKLTLNQIRKNLKNRDFSDKYRAISPLIKSKDSIVVDTSFLNKKQMVNKLSKIVEEKLKRKYGKFK